MSFVQPISNDNNNLTPPRPTSSAKGGRISGMFRKSGRKTRSAIRGGGSGVGRRIVPAGGGGTDSSDSTATAPALVVMNKNCPTGAIGIGSAIRSPFITPRAGNGTNADLEQARSFYFSPLNSWNDHGAQGNDDFPQQQHAHNIHIATATDALITDDVERTLRQIVICCTIFIAGTMLSEHAPVAYHILELALVAWGTSLFIMIMEKRRMVRTATTTSPAKRTIVAEISSSLGTHKIIEAMEKPTTSFTSDLQGSFGEELTTIRRKRSRHEIITEPDSDERPSPEALPELTMELAVSTASKRQNPHLEHLYVMMVGSGCQRIVPNCTTYDIDTDLFSGKMLLMFRTPDVDEPTKTNDPMVNYFRGKQRRFEFQWQLRLKKLPPGDLFLGVEVDEPIQMGMIQRALANTALKFTKKMNQVSISRKDRTCSVSSWFLCNHLTFLFHSSRCTSCRIHVGILLLFFGFIG